MIDRDCPKIVVKFVTRHGVYTKNEMAGFPAHVADLLVSRGVAVRVGPMTPRAARPGSGAASTGGSRG